jgi:hypothetical protein
MLNVNMNIFQYNNQNQISSDNNSFVYNNNNNFFNVNLINEMNIQNLNNSSISHAVIPHNNISGYCGNYSMIGNYMNNNNSLSQ